MVLLELRGKPQFILRLKGNDRNFVLAMNKSYGKKGDFWTGWFMNRFYNTAETILKHDYRLELYEIINDLDPEPHDYVVDTFVKSFVKIYIEQIESALDQFYSGK